MTGSLIDEADPMGGFSAADRRERQDFLMADVALQRSLASARRVAQSLSVQVDAIKQALSSGGTTADAIVDFLLSIGMRPIVELGFMPSTLSSGGDVVFHYKGNVTPPKNMAEWSLLVGKLAQHWVDRYGEDEVAQWPIEVWNEPNLPAFWSGDQAGYFALFHSSWQAIKGVSRRLQVGGPASAQNRYPPVRVRCLT